MNRIDKQILGIALPSIVSNITVPLLGLVDVTIVGHLGSAAYIGAIAVGGMLFNIIYWIFGFLRMGTSGMTSQLYGRRDWREVTRMLVRAVGIGIGVGICFIILQVPIREIAFLLIHPTDEVRQLATVYFHICIWGAPAMLGLYGLTGWFIGMQNSRIPMGIAITQNVVNIAASLGLVYGCGLKVEGVALGTLIAQYAGFLMGATPQALEDRRRGLYSYEALRSRLQEGKFSRPGTRDLLAPVIHLEPLTPEEMLILCEKLTLIHADLYSYERKIGTEELTEFIKLEYSRIGAEENITPREVIRDFIELLDLLYQNPGMTIKEMLQSDEFEYTASGAVSDTADEAFEGFSI